jgi:hypothetical protein
LGPGAGIWVLISRLLRVSVRATLPSLLVAARAGGDGPLSASAKDRRGWELLAEEGVEEG